MPPRTRTTIITETNPEDSVLFLAKKEATKPLVLAQASIIRAEIKQLAEAATKSISLHNVTPLPELNEAVTDDAQEQVLAQARASSKREYAKLKAINAARISLDQNTSDIEPVKSPRILDPEIRIRLLSLLHEATTPEAGLLNIEIFLADNQLTVSPRLNEIGLPINSLEAKIEDMVLSASQRQSPASPYHSSQWESPLKFIEVTYGKYLKFFGAEENWLYQDQLRKIHPSRSDLQRIGGSAFAQNYGSQCWGEDIYAALKNYLRNRKQDSSPKLQCARTVTDVVPPKKSRSEYYGKIINTASRETSEIMKNCRKINMLSYRHR